MFQNGKQFSLKSLSISGIHLNEIYIKCCLLCMLCFTKPRVDFISTKPEFYAIKLYKKYFEELCSILTLIDVFRHMSCFLNCFQLYYMQLVLGSVFENDGKNDVLLFCFRFAKRKMKQRVSGSSIWFENKIVDVVLSICFRKMILSL